MNMNTGRRGKTLRRMAVVVSVAFAMTALAGPARADHVEEGLGILFGGIVGGSIGSAIGKGSGRKVAIGVGSVLGALYGGEVATHHRRSRAASRHTAPRHSPAYEVVEYVRDPVPVYVQPTPVYFTSSQAAERSITLSSSGGSTTFRHTQPSITECRLLEAGLSPVYGCRDSHGNWRILR